TKQIQPTSLIFKKITPQLATHLAHAIAAQTDRDTKTMARAKSHNASKLFNVTLIRLTKKHEI
ncbi:MAG: hypothetical protein DI539_30035, partial [Flavobacterium psychrophilum]